MSELGLRHSENVAAADWITPRLRGFASGIAAVVPDGFPAYVRILHPVCDGRGNEASWADVAAWSGRTMHRLVQFHAIARPAAAGPDDAEPWGAEPKSGNLPVEHLRVLCATLAEHTSAAVSCWFCLWDGWGQLHGSRVMLFARNDGRPAPPPQPIPPVLAPEMLNGPRVSLPHRDYILFEGSLEAAPTFSEVVGGGFTPQSPNLFWPDDHAWCVATEIDLFCTIVAGSEALADALQTEPLLETWRVEPGDPVTCDSDQINT